MASNLAAADAITKVGYGDIHEQLDDAVVALKFVEKGSKDLTFGGVEAQFAIHTGRSRGLGSRKEGQNLPTAGASKDARASVFLKYQYGRIEGTGQVFKQVTENTQGFVNWMKREVTDLKVSLNRDLNRQVYGDGTGTLALVATAGTTTSVVLDDVHWLEEQMVIDILTAATLANTTPTQANALPLVITAIDNATNTITVSQAVTTTVGSALVLADVDNVENNWKNEWEGLGLIVSNTSTLHTINPSTTPIWKAGYIENNVGVLAEIDLTHLVQGIHQKGASISDLLTTPGVINSYWSSLQGLRRFDGGEKLKGGVTTPVFQSIFGDIPFTADWACPRGTIYGIDKKSMFIHQQGDWSWIDETGSMWQQVPNKHAFSATLWKFSNIGVYRRNAFGKLTGITES